MRNIIVFFLFALFSMSALGQSQVAKEFEENSKGYKFFAYQSVLRILNQDKNPDFNKLIRNLDHLRVVTTDSTGSDGLKVFHKLDQDIQNEGFEEIMTFDNKDYRCHVYELSKNSKKSTWMATFYMQGRAGLFEMVGSLDMRYLSALANLDMDQLQELAGKNIPSWD